MDAQDSLCEEVAQTFENSAATIELALAPLLSAVDVIMSGNLAQLKTLIDPSVKIKAMIGHGSSSAEFKKTMLVDSKLLGCMLYTSCKQKSKLFWPFAYTVYKVKLTFHFVVAYATNEEEILRLQNIYEQAFSNTIRNAEALANQHIDFSDTLCCSSTNTKLPSGPMVDDVAVT